MRGTFMVFALIGALVLAGCSGSPGRSDASSAPPSTAVATPPPIAPLTTSAGPTADPTVDPPTTSVPAAVGTEVPADVPTTGPNLLRKGERPPVMPLLATQHTAAGAVAFAKFFILTIDWGFATTSGAYMRHYYLSSCIDCENHAAGLDLTRKDGSHYIGDRLNITHAEAASLGDHSNAERSVIVTFDLTAAEVIDKHGKPVRAEIGHHGYRQQLWLSWGGEWRVVAGQLLV